MSTKVPVVSNITSETGLKSWQIAIILASPVAVGATAFWIYSRNQKRSQSKRRMALERGKAKPVIQVKEVKEMTSDEKALMNAITSGDFDEIETIVRTSNLKLNFVDENGMTPLQNACYKGDLETCKFLIERGADVNANRHVHGYTALMFAALGGHERIVSLLLDSGASTSAVNSVGRTASAMAAFVGQHKVVAIINNFVPKEEIEAYAKKGGEKEERNKKESNKEALLPFYLVDPVHTLVRAINVHPVRLVFAINANKGLLDHGQKVITVLHSLRDKEMQKEDPNEALALKFHFLAFFIGEIMKFDSKSDSTERSRSEPSKSEPSKSEPSKSEPSKSEPSKSEPSRFEPSRFEPLIKTWIKGRDEDGFPLNLEIMLRASIREFPFRDSVLFLQLVKTLSSVEMGSEPSAVSILFQSINGQKGFDDDVPVCSTCCEPNPPKRCSACQTIPYCDQYCQKLHWFSHKKFCAKLKQNYEQNLAKKMSQITTNESSSKNGDPAQPN